MEIEKEQRRDGIAWYLSFEGMRMNDILIEYSFLGAV
jgi:hypothetical protein